MTPSQCADRTSFPLSFTSSFPPPPKYRPSIRTQGCSLFFKNRQNYVLMDPTSPANIWAPYPPPFLPPSFFPCPGGFVLIDRYCANTKCPPPSFFNLVGGLYQMQNLSKPSPPLPLLFSHYSQSMPNHDLTSSMCWLPTNLKTNFHFPRFPPLTSH